MAIYHAAANKNEVGCGCRTKCAKLSGKRRFNNFVSVSTAEWNSLPAENKCKNCVDAIRAARPQKENEANDLSMLLRNRLSL